ncbi:DUF4097 family beta strand repeat-containing protein [Kineococcus sp. SYSU DK003]|uniref:hypothetical protein n=1 Tax=Kineococcus sp. SYSU DK003 TaxID=3383124 RepID=UPI003D7CBFF2
MSAGKVAAGVLAGLAVAAGSLSALGQMTSVDVRVAERAAVGDRLVVVLGVGDVSIRAGQVGEVSVTGTVTHSWGRAEHGFTRQGDTLVFRSDCEVGSLPGPCSADWTLTVPAGLDVEVTSEAGDVELVGEFSAARVETSAGDLDVTVPGDGTGYAVRGGSLVGDRTVEVPADDDGPVLDLNTGAGDVTVTTS